MFLIIKITRSLRSIVTSSGRFQLLEFKKLSPLQSQVQWNLKCNNTCQQTQAQEASSDWKTKLISKVEVPDFHF